MKNIIFIKRTLIGLVLLSVFVGPNNVFANDPENVDVNSVSATRKTSVERRAVQRQKPESRADSEQKSITQRDQSNPDFNSDGTVGHSDLRILLNQWHKECGQRSFCLGDLNSDGTVNLKDSEILILAWNDPSPAFWGDIKEKCKVVSDVRECITKYNQNSEIEAHKTKIIKAVTEREKNKPEDASSFEVEKFEKRTENYLRFMTNILEKMTAAVTRFDTLTERISSRITKFEDAGRDLSESKALLEKAKVKIEESRTGISNLSGVYAEIINGDKDTMKEFFSRIKTMVKDLSEDIRDAHKILVEVITSMKVGLN